MADRVPASDLLAAESLPWTSALLIEVRFGLEGRSFGCHLVFLMAQSEINAAAHALDAFLVGM